MAPTSNDYPLTASLEIREQGQETVPSCAIPCLNHFKSTGWSCDADDLSCLCSQYSLEGLTLGELAYGCSNFGCDSSTITTEERKTLYNICSGEKNAVVARHSIVTLPAYATTFSTKAPTSASATSSHSTTVTNVSPMSPSSTTHTSETQTAATGESSVPAQGASKQSTSLTTPQAVGISIGAMAALILAGALIYLLIWCKRRRTFKSPRARNDSFDFIDKGAHRHSPSGQGNADPRRPLEGFAKPRVEHGAGSTASGWYARQNEVPSPEHRPEHRPEPQPQSDRSISPESRTHDSLRTISQLLPEKAGQTPPQPQYRSPRAASVFSTATIFEEDGKTPRLLSPATMVPMPVAPKPVLRTVPRRPERPDQPVYSALFTSSPVDMRKPQSALSSPSKSVRRNLTPAPLKNVPYPPPPMLKVPHVTAGRSLSSEFRVSAHRSVLPPSSVPSYMPDYYTSDDSRSPTFDMITPPQRRPVISFSKPAKSAHPPKSYRCSGGSDTSFESTDPDEITPPEEIDRLLSPVPEGDSPTRNIKYPKVPRSSNQAVPRSPQPTLSPSYRHSTVWPLKDTLHTPTKPSTPNPKTPPHHHQHQHQHSLSGSTLAAKRLGSSAATTLSNGLHIKSSSNPQASPLKGYGRPANSNSIRGGRPLLLSQRKPSYAGTGYGPDPGFDPRTPEMSSPGPKIMRTDRDVVLKSPLWEPKLTPSRRGEDLFLSVSLASPGVAPAGYGSGGEVNTRRR